jgi:VWFA-related protein
LTTQRLGLTLHRAAAAIAVTAALAAALHAFPQNQTPQPIPRFRAGVEGVVVDVSVLDKDRLPVRGLTAADFTISEDGKPQPITTFTAIDMPDVVQTSSAPWIRDVPHDVRRNDDLAERRVVVVVLDDATPMLAEEVQPARRLARAALEHLGPDDLVAVVHAVNSRAGQGFTSDRAKLIAAVDRFNGAIPMPTMGRELNAPMVPGSYLTMSSEAMTLYLRMADTLREWADYMGELPHRRKALMYVSVGMPLDYSIVQADVANPSGGGGAFGDVANHLRDAIRAAQRSNVAIYGLDPGGLRGWTPGDAGGGKLNRDFLEGLSASTGGFAVTSTNDPDPGLTQVVRENSSYYLLGYEPANGGGTGKYRKVEVKVNRPGMTVRARNGYYESAKAPAKTAPKADAKSSPLADAVAGILPRSDLPLQLTAVPIQVAGRREAEVALVLGVSAYVPARTTRAVLQVDMAVSAFSLDGTRRAFKHENVPVNLNTPGPAKTVGFELLSSIELPPGRYELRAAAEAKVEGGRVSDRNPAVDQAGDGDDRGSRSGSVYCDLEIPEFSKERLALSGIALKTSPPPPSGPPGALAKVLPVVPTVLREFMPTDNISGFVRVSQGGTAPAEPVTIGFALVDGQGATVGQRSEVLDTARFAGSRMSDYEFSVPLSQLAAGPYLLTVSANSGSRKASRDVRFKVVR